MTACALVLLLIVCGCDGPASAPQDAAVVISDGSDVPMDYTVLDAPVIPSDMTAPLVDHAQGDASDMRTNDLQQDDDLSVAADMAKTCGLRGLPCCSFNVCMDNSQCSGLDGGRCYAGCDPFLCFFGCGAEGKHCCGLYTGCLAGLTCMAVDAFIDPKVQVANSYCVNPMGCGQKGQLCCDEHGLPIPKIGGPGIPICVVGYHCSGGICQQ